MRAVDFGGAVLSAEVQERSCGLVAKWVRIFLRDGDDIAYDDSMPVDVDTGGAKAMVQAVG